MPRIRPFQLLLSWVVAAFAVWVAAAILPGLKQGDRVAAFMPNMPETVIAMLATASLGAAFTSCSPDFGVQGVLDRFGQIEPRILIAAESHVYGGKTFDHEAEITQRPRVVVRNRPGLGRVARSNAERCMTTLRRRRRGRGGR